MTSPFAGQQGGLERTPSPSPRHALTRRSALIGGGVTAAIGAALAAGLVLDRNHGGTPTFAGASGWLNTDPLGAAALRGRVVLVDFWTFTCINWVRTAPYVRAWDRKYRADGLVVIGVHTPEFSFEHDVDLVRGATRERGIEYPVAIDNDYEIWRAFNNNYWPALYFVDRQGEIRHHHFGEGSYEESESNLQRMLGVSRELVSVVGHGVEAEADWQLLRSPETYLGSSRGTGIASSSQGGSGERHVFELPSDLSLNQWALAGEWTIEPERVVLGEGGGSIVHRFHSRDAHLVLSSDTGAPIPFRVALDGEAPGDSCGEDVDEDGNGILRDGRLYQLTRAHDTVRERVLQITFEGAGAQAYSFTFG